MTDLLTDDGPEGARWGLRGRSGGLMFRLYTSNPFYVISADLVFVGLRMSFDTHGKSFETWALMLGLAAYTLLLAVTACWLIRRGRVWDDVRSVLLVVVMMFLAMSVTFDNTLAENTRLGTACFLGGWLFAVAVSEGLLRGIGLALPFWYRAPYYLLLTLFFVYPVALSPLLDRPESPELQWALFGFSTVAGLLFLSLIPAVRKGASYVAGNGSPWPWPLYPWTLFGLLALAVAARASYLCTSFHFVDWSARESTNSIFAPYFLTPFLFALNLLVLEAGLASRRRAVQQLALGLPIGILAVAALGYRDDLVYQRFLGLFTNGLGGTPLYLTPIATTCFYAFAAIRTVPWAWGGLASSLAALAVIGPETFNWSGLRDPSPWPILAFALLEASLCWRRRESWRGLLAAVGFVTAVGLALPDRIPVSRTLLVLQLTIVATLILGALFDDRLGRWLQNAGAFAHFLACAAAILGVPQLDAGTSPQSFERLALLSIVVALGYGAIMKNRLYFVEAAAAATLWLSVVGWKGYLLARQLLVGLDLIVCGLAFFLLAALISLKKAGAFPNGFPVLWKRAQNEL